MEARDAKFAADLAASDKKTQELVASALADVKKAEEFAVKPLNAFNAASDAILAQTLKSYGLQGVAQTIATIRASYPEISSENLLMLLKEDTRYNAEYLKRFAGNAKLKEAGLPTLQDSEYLKAENEYKKIFTAYGATSLANQDYYATLIGNRMDAVDVTDRMNTAYARLQASPEVKKAFQTFYSAVSDGDILAAILDPKTQLPILQKKVAAAEIGGAALKQGLETSLATATELEGLGVTQAQAQAGYSTIAQALPGYEKLLEMRTGEDIKKADAQALLEESKLKKNARAIQQEQQVIAEEAARFQGSAGRLASKDRAQGLI
jgi:truncated hemoglobin YjbI